MKHKIMVSVLVILAALAASAALGAAQDSPPPDVPLLVRTNGGGWLGVELEDVTQAKAQQLKLPGVYGAIVTRVEENSPAAKAGLQANDVIVKFAGTRVWSVAQLAQWVRQTPTGREVPLRVSRDGKLLDLKVDIGSAPAGRFGPRFNISGMHLPEFFNFSFSPTRARLGVRVEDLTPQLASYFGVKQGKGVLVTEVEKGSAAEKAGVKAGDCIVRVDSTEINSVPDLVRALRGASKQPATLEIVRNGREESINVTLAPPWNPFPRERSQEFQRRLQHEAQQLQGQSARLAADAAQIDSQKLQRRLQDEVNRLQEELPRIQQREKQLESCVEALESHLFEQTARPVEQTHMVRGPHGPVVSGPGCPSASATM